MGDMGYPSLLTMPLRRDSDCDGSTLSRFADFFSSSAAGIPLGSPYVENEIEAGCDAARCGGCSTRAHCLEFGAGTGGRACYLFGLAGRWSSLSCGASINNPGRTVPPL